MWIFGGKRFQQREQQPLEWTVTAVSEEQQGSQWLTCSDRGRAVGEEASGAIKHQVMRGL